MEYNFFDVIYYPGCRVKYMEPEIGKITINILKKNDIRPIIVPQKCCGIPTISCGDKEGFLKHAIFNINQLHNQNRNIVTECTSCALTLKREYPEIVKDERSELIANRTYDIIEYLSILKHKKVLKTSFKNFDLKVFYHLPCHLKVLGPKIIEDRIRLMRLIPDIKLVGYKNSGCCGMGGTFGFKEKNFDMSMTMGQPLFDKIQRHSPDLVATECPTCKIQIEQGTGFRVVHPIEIFGIAYGLKNLFYSVQAPPERMHNNFDTIVPN